MIIILQNYRFVVEIIEISSPRPSKSLSNILRLNLRNFAARPSTLNCDVVPSRRVFRFAVLRSKYRISARAKMRIVHTDAVSVPPLQVRTWLSVVVRTECFFQKYSADYIVEYVWSKPRREKGNRFTNFPVWSK